MMLSEAKLCQPCSIVPDTTCPLQTPAAKGMDIWEEVIKPEDKELLEAGTDSSGNIFPTAYIRHMVP